MSTETDLKQAEDALYRANVARSPTRGRLLAEVQALRDQYAREVNNRDRPRRPAPAVPAAPPAAVAPVPGAKVLTVRQPWAAAILAGLKDVEYRSWTTRHRGALFIHAAARRADADALAEFAELDPAAMVYSAIVGAVDLVDVEDYGDGYGWILRNPRRLERPFPCRGALSLWKPPAGIVLP